MSRSPSRPLLVLLAAGAGSRFERNDHKLNAPLCVDAAVADLDVGPVAPRTVAPRTVAGWAITNALAAEAGDLAIVVGATDLDELDAFTGPDNAGLGNAGLGEPGLGESGAAATTPRIIVINNPDWAGGQATSLASAVRFARQAGYDAIVIGLADQPSIHPDAWRRVALSKSPIAFATYDGRQGHPVRLAAETWDELPTSGDQGARDLVRLRRAEAEAIPCSGSAADIDTVEDLTTWQNHSSTSSPSTARSTRPGP